MNGLSLVLFICYSFLCCLFISRSKQFRHPVISRGIFIAVFIIKLFAGLAYGYVYSRQPYILTSDTWQVFQKSLTEYKVLLHDPLRFIKTTFVFTGDISFSNFTQTDTSYWNILKEVIIIKFEALLNLFSFGNYYVNTVLYGLLVFLGSNALFKTLEKVYPDRPYLNLFSCFLIPSMVFWTSAVYKDGLLFFLMAVITWQTMQWLLEKRNSLRYFTILLFSLAGLFLLRTYVPLLLVPPLAGWIISEKSGKKAGWIFAGVYSVCALLIVLLRFIYPAFDVIHLLAVWQNAFLQLPANSALPAKHLEPTVAGLFRNLPQSANFGLLRPFLWENKGKQYLLFAFELLALQVLFLFSIFYSRPASSRQSAFRFFCFSLAITACLFLGYTVNIIGAFVRYRSIFYPFLFSAVLGLISISRRGASIK